MTTHTSKTFRSGNSEALRLPKDMAFGPDVELTLVKTGDVLTVYPKRAPLEALFEALDALPLPSSVEVRDTDPLPEPKGL